MACDSCVDVMRQSVGVRYERPIDACLFYEFTLSRQTSLKKAISTFKRPFR